MRQIIRLQLDRVGRRMRENHNAEFTYTGELVDCIAGRCREVESGARNVDHILTRSLLPEISQEILTRMAQGLPPVTGSHHRHRSGRVPVQSRASNAEGESKPASASRPSSIARHPTWSPSSPFGSESSGLIMLREGRPSANRLAGFSLSL
jgi:hypothetical protein